MLVIAQKRSNNKAIINRQEKVEVETKMRISTIRKTAATAEQNKPSVIFKNLKTFALFLQVCDVRSNR